jgi:ornithine carbamoyltransferase
MVMGAPRHFLDISDFDAATLNGILSTARAMKDARKGWPKGLREKDEPLKGRMLALIFERPSTRTRVSFEVGMRQLGGETLVLSSNDMQLGRGETIADTAKVLSRYVDGIMIRASRHSNLTELAEAATVPVINGLTNLTHPCQVMADVMTLEEHVAPLKNLTVSWVGDGNNVAASWIHAVGRLGGKLKIGAPKELAPGRK